MNDPTVDKALAATRQLNPQGLYSHAAEQAATLPQAKGTPQQMMAAMKGVKPEEMVNSGAQQAFAGQPSVTREQLAQHFQQAMPKLQETRLDDSNEGASEDDSDARTKYGEYTLPNGDNYRELLMHLPDKSRRYPSSPETERAHRETYDALLRHIAQHGANMYTPELHQLTTAQEAAQRAHADAMAALREQAAAAKNFTSSHWDQPNVVAHLRMSDRRDPTDPNGDKLLHLEELQSDWGQAGREKGFKGERESDMARVMAARDAAPDGPLRMAAQARVNEMAAKPHNTPKGPYVGSTNGWVDLGLKRALHEAAKGDYSRLAWTPGAEQADRYGLHKKFKRISYMTSPRSELGGLNAHFLDNPGGISRNIHEHELPDYLGKELAERLLAAPKEDMGGGDIARVLEGNDMQTGGEGMKAFYDKLLPGRLKEIVRKLGHEAQLEPVTIKHGTRKKGEPHQTALHSLVMTPELKESILKGMPAYKQGGDVSEGCVAGDVVGKALRVTARPAKLHAMQGNTR